MPIININGKTIPYTFATDLIKDVEPIPEQDLDIDVRGISCGLYNDWRAECTVGKCKYEILGGSSERQVKELLLKLLNYSLEKE